MNRIIQEIRFPEAYRASKRVAFDNLELVNLPSQMVIKPDVSIIDMSSNDLTTLPAPMQGFDHIKVLNIAYNGFTHLPESIRACSELEALYVAGCPLQDLPPWLPELSNLRILDISATDLVNLPSILQYLPRLEILHMSYLPWTHLPSWIADMAMLRTIIIDHMPQCDLTAISTIPRLHHLVLTNMELTDVPPWIQQLQFLTTLDLSGNPIIGIPDWLGTLPLVVLGLGYTNVQKSPHWEHWHQLRILDLVRCNHVETILKTALPPNLTSLDISNTPFADIPSTVRTLKCLKELNVQKTLLRMLPSWLFEELPLTSLDISHLEIDHFPRLSHPIALENLMFRHGSTPYWPSILSQTPSLKLLDFEDTHILENDQVISVIPSLKEFITPCYGKIPSLFDHFPNLINLKYSLSDTAALESNLQSLHLLRMLVIRGEKITELPTAIAQMKNLEILDVRYNALLALPIWLQELQHLKQLEVGYNTIYEIPSWLVNIAQLQNLDISANPLSKFPDWLHTMPHLQAIDFQFPPDDLALQQHQEKFLARGVRCNVRSPQPRDEF